ncbi:unnamed protein product [Ascophyllum nodosum]
MQTDSDLQMFFTKVDGSFPARRKDLQPIIVWKSSKTPIATEFRLPIPVEHSGSVVDYSFETLENDILFEVVFNPAEDGRDAPEGGEGEEIVVEGQRFESHMGTVTGTIPLTRPGRLTLVWDNRYSWFKHKVLSYSVTLHVPSLVATERAKCARAVNALRACARERERMYFRVEQGTIDGQEVDQTVQRLRVEVEELQRKLNAASQLAEQLWRDVEDCQQREELEGRKIEGLTFRLMPQTVLGHTLSFGSKEDLWWQVCKDWLEVMSPAPRGEENGAQD